MTCHQASTMGEVSMLDEFDMNAIEDLQAAKTVMTLLLNMVENIKQENQQLKDQNQCLKDEINRLKGEQGKPKIKPNKSDKPDNDKPVSMAGLMKLV